MALVWSGVLFSYSSSAESKKIFLDSTNCVRFSLLFTQEFLCQEVGEIVARQIGSVGQLRHDVCACVIQKVWLRCEQAFEERVPSNFRTAVNVPFEIVWAKGHLDLTWSTCTPRSTRFFAERFLMQVQGSFGLVQGNLRLAFALYSGSSSRWLREESSEKGATLGSDSHGCFAKPHHNAKHIMYTQYLALFILEWHIFWSNIFIYGSCQCVSFCSPQQPTFN